VYHNRAAAFKPTGAIFSHAPVERCTDDGEREFVTVSWNYALAERASTTAGHKSLASKFWRKSFDERRCLVPAT